MVSGFTSSLARGTWIEIQHRASGRCVCAGRPSQEGRGLKYGVAVIRVDGDASSLARGTWIEI